MCDPIGFIKALADLIVSKSQPEKIILFGSYAYGHPTSKSDIDILVILRESSLSRSERAAYLYNQLRELSHYPKDIVVYTQDEVKKWENVRQAFITSIIKKGKVLYEK